MSSGRQGSTERGVGCPTFRPSIEDFADPLAYIASIRTRAEHFGICRIVPPADWRPQLALNKKTRVKTSVQLVHELQERSTAADAAFVQQYPAFLDSRGKQVLKKPPAIAGQDVDLGTLFRLASRRGGYEKLTNTRSGWRELCRLLQVSCCGGALAQCKSDLLVQSVAHGTRQSQSLLILYDNSIMFRVVLSGVEHIYPGCTCW